MLSTPIIIALNDVYNILLSVVKTPRHKLDHDAILRLKLYTLGKAICLWCKRVFFIWGVKEAKFH